MSADTEIPAPWWQAKDCLSPKPKEAKELLRELATKVENLGTEEEKYKFTDHVWECIVLFLYIYSEHSPLSRSTVRLSEVFAAADENNRKLMLMQIQEALEEGTIAAMKKVLDQYV